MYLLATNSKSLFFAGDTGLENNAIQLMERTIRSQGATLDVALLPIGYAPKWKPRFRRGHLSAMDALTLFEQLEARHFIPYHWGTFRHVTSTAFDAIRELREYIGSHRRGSDVVILEPGESFEEPA
jgi:L-ascorbate metabolism protein UlaG (beta-lactamase superfamily)